jgi:2-polyprenyl-6-hydroxyphenyl methylase/3-demethylubiquinone-9 3-methyltransferase
VPHNDLESDLKFDVNTHYRFGENWEVYASRIDEERIERSSEELARILGSRDLSGKTLLDIGCGSGIQAVSALRMGAKHVRAIDIDPDSVRTTKETLARYWPSGSGFSVEQQNVLEAPELGLFDIVYSWGVLHHTGDMWEAVRQASRYVAPGGTFSIALYRKTPWCDFWTWEKRYWVNAGPVYRQFALWAYVSLKVFRDLRKLQNPIRRMRAYRYKRGMHWYTSATDWVGGYPYESASAEEVCAFVEPLGFELVNAHKTKPSSGFLGTGNAEYRFRRIDGGAAVSAERAAT